MCQITYMGPGQIPQQQQQQQPWHKLLTQWYICKIRTHRQRLLFQGLRGNYSSWFHCINEEWMCFSWSSEAYFTVNRENASASDLPFKVQITSQLAGREDDAWNIKMLSPDIPNAAAWSFVCWIWTHSITVKGEALIILGVRTKTNQSVHLFPNNFLFPNPLCGTQPKVH